MASNITAKAQNMTVTMDGVELAQGKPIVILATGQSNIANHPEFPWVPPDNLFLWNWDGMADSPLVVGTAFDPMDNSSMGVAYSFAAQAAINNPSRNVYVVNVGVGALPISKWMLGNTAPDMFAACKMNIEAALSVVGSSQIDHLLWWQGENDALAFSQTYVQDFESVLTRFRGEGWFDYHTPVTIMAVSPYPNSVQKFFNNVLRQVVAREPENRIFVDTTMLSPAHWDPQGYTPPLLIHMTNQGYKKAGELAYRASYHGIRQTSQWQIVAKHYGETRAQSSTLGDDQELYFPVFTGKTYRVRGAILGATSHPGDFKYGFRGPSGSVIHTYHHQMRYDSPNSEFSAMSAATYFPSGQSVPSSGAFRIEVDMIVINPTSAGQVYFQWSQMTANPNGAFVLAGSYLEYFEIITL